VLRSFEFLLTLDIELEGSRLSLFRTIEFDLTEQPRKLPNSEDRLNRRSVEHDTSFAIEDLIKETS
jgi:hypothetical protein